MEKVKHIFITSILPELMGKFHSRTSSVQSGVEPQEPDQSVTSFSLNKDTSVNTGNDELLTYCYCKGPEEGEMVGCDNSECVYRWFHLKCLILYQSRNFGTAQTAESILNFKERERRK